MNSHDELSYIKIITRIIEEMSNENDRMKREIVIHRVVMIVLTILVVFLLIIGVN